jgi:signal transduction histidine kinase
MVLIVDDKPENILPLRKILELHSFEVDSALSGEEALRKVLKSEYELIILDVQMPGMDGFEVAEALSGYSKAQDIPIIFLSAVNTDKKFITRGYQTGGIDYITKPVDTDILILKAKSFSRLYKQNKALKDYQQKLQREIESRKHAQEEQKQILEAIPQIAFTLGPAGNIEYTNNAWFDYASDANTWPRVHREDEIMFRKAWESAMSTGKEVELEVRILRGNSDESVWHLMRAIPLRENDTIQKWVGTFTNIDEQKQLEKRKDEFIGIASHELKTPLTSIKAYFQLMERMLNASSNNADEKKFLQKSSEQLNKLNQLITDLLDVSKIQSGKIRFTRKITDFDKLVDSVVESMQQTHPSHNIRRTGRSNVLVDVDANRIEQVIINYLTNAIKYSPGGKEVMVEITVKGEHVELRVKDFGIGIPKDKTGKVFQKFYRVEDSDKFQGLGIGLFICAEIIGRHGGRFGVDSELDEGSEFYFTLPVAENKKTADE